MLSSSLQTTIAQATPKDVKLSIRHLVTSPTLCPPLFSPPPGHSDEHTRCENHFLTVSICPDLPTEDVKDDGAELFIFAIEVLVFTTANLTTIFVSKADSTGYLYILKLPPTAKSLMRSIATSFLSHLISLRQRHGIRLVLSLFARAQNQYLFPGSMENPHKHILDDRGLVKWWCRVIDPIVRRYEPETQVDVSNGRVAGEKDCDSEAKAAASATAYLIVPGCDKFESRAFLPPSAKLDPQDRRRWLNSYPLHQICGSRTAPPRCQVPRFPDDPKSRFLLELDDEIPDITNEMNSGQWLSIKTIDQFWEMMAFRQECSSGRLVGFLWVVINPPGLLNSVPMAPSTCRNENDQATYDCASVLDDKCISRMGDATTLNSISETEPNHPSGGSITRELEVQPQGKGTYDAISPPQPDSGVKETPTHPTESLSESAVGTIILSDENYQDLMKLLVELDFDNEKAAVESTNSWLSKLSTIIGRSNHGVIVIGECQSIEPSTQESTNTLNLLSGGLIRKRKRGPADTETPMDGDARPDSSMTSTREDINGQEESPRNSDPQITAPTINVLNGCMIRKKHKKEDS
ncbi:uncharacterized protein PADG_07483 [Paracoccidioides brasiliensis Pb18]|uniref:histone acetyltransferase n=1 Tax=Paracoccidioides brasiliensis (strain Pb18) TaxID=502780 RepID=C1GJP7_PARBD|nr:uncharacterized protein PADG_07483 [Paracoccidioides brasiliensis Pb18]EEH42663.2 hypothetical protein PADG_07483 [Paracoccidioides brasiliensis Pb18]